MAPPHWYRFDRGPSTMGAPDVSCSEHVRAEMQPGELLHWIGRPDPAALVRSRQKFLWGGLLVFAFSVLWEMGVWFGDVVYPRPLVLLWGVPFILCGAGLVLYAPASFWLARRMAYAVTDRRLLIVHGFPRRRIESFWPADINMLAITEDFRLKLRDATPHVDG